MDFRALRISGIIVSGALIGGAALYAMTAPPVTHRAPSPRAPVAVHQNAAPIAFAISLRGDGPLARAQRLAMRGGREAGARRQVERELARQSAFRGLCFDHFAPRGDIVLRVCHAGTVDADWHARLRAIPAVTNVDALEQLTHDGRGD